MTVKVPEFFQKLAERLIKEYGRVANSKIKKGYSPSDKVEGRSENRKSLSDYSIISSERTEDSESNQLELAIFSESVKILSELVKMGRFYNNEEFYQILQNRYKDNFGPLDFEKVKSKLVQTGLLTKTISNYFPTQLTIIDSIEPSLLDKIPTLVKSRKEGKDLYINKSFRDTVISLSKRERDILFKRYFIEKPQTLRILSQHYNLSRERIRQIEGRVLVKLKEKKLHVMFLFELIKLGSPSILSIEQLLVINESLKIESENSLCLVRTMQKIVNLNFCFLGDKIIYFQYKNYPAISRLNIENWLEETHIPKEEFKYFLIKQGFNFLTEHESEVLYNHYSEQHRDKASLKNLIMRSLKLIGCPAHYSDITEKVREMGGEKNRNCSYNSIHAALSWNDEFVWVGKKGVYGLKEWGLSPLDKSLEDQVHGILKDSEKPLSKESIATELSKQRPYFSKTSLNLILSMNEKIIKTQDNLYRAANKKDIEVEKVKKVQMDKISDAMKEVFKEWKEHKNG